MLKKYKMKSLADKLNAEGAGVEAESAKVKRPKKPKKVEVKKLKSARKRKK